MPVKSSGAGQCSGTTAMDGCPKIEPSWEEFPCALPFPLPELPSAQPVLLPLPQHMPGRALPILSTLGWEGALLGTSAIPHEPAGPIYAGFSVCAGL